MSARVDVSSYDDRLLDEARQGNASAFGELVNKYRPYLKTVAARILDGRLPSDGSDVVESSVGVALERLAQCEGQQTLGFLRWLAGIVRNKAYLELRRAGRVGPLPAGSSDDEQLVEDRTGPDEQVAKREQAAQLLAAIERLPADYRTVIRLRNLEELPFEEVAMRMGRSHDAVRQLWVSAFKRLKTEMRGSS